MQIFLDTKFSASVLTQRSILDQIVPTPLSKSTLSIASVENYHGIISQGTAQNLFSRGYREGCLDSRIPNQAHCGNPRRIRRLRKRGILCGTNSNSGSSTVSICRCDRLCGPDVCEVGVFQRSRALCHQGCKRWISHSK